MTSIDFASKVYDALAKNHIYIDGYIDFCKQGFQRFRVKGSRKPGKPLFVAVLTGGIAFGDWRDASTWKTWWEKSFKEITFTERKQRTLEQISIQKEQDHIRSKAIARAETLLNHTSCIDANPDHGYVISKRIVPYYAKQIRSYLIIPIVTIDLKLQSLQYINPYGRKRFKKNTTFKNGFALLGDDLIGEQIWLCEGWATGCTVKELTNQIVVCAMSASNIYNVALVLRRKYPKTTIVIAADNDKAGIEAARSASQLSNVYYVYPPHAGMDFNDFVISDNFSNVSQFIMEDKKWNTQL